MKFWFQYASHFFYQEEFFEDEFYLDIPLKCLMTMNLDNFNA